MARTGREALLLLGERDAATIGIGLSHDGKPLDATRASSELAARLGAIVALTVDNPPQNDAALRARNVERRIAALLARRSFARACPPLSMMRTA